MSPASLPDAAVIALDFDGVICDSLEEGLLISYNGHAGAPARAFVDPGWDGLSPELIERFTRCRPFTRHLGHWLVALLDGPTPHSDEAFVAQYEALPGDAIEAFVTAADAYRTEVRRAYPDQWLAHHRVEHALGGVLADAYVVTARDAESVRMILVAHEMKVDDARIFGSLRDKQGALETIRVREGVPAADVTLVDDSIANCIAARQAGYSAWWATWGYGAAGDTALAAVHGIPAVSVDDLRTAERVARVVAR